jgi:phage repressor protein C with HTH and peptisase S24 domain
MNERRIIELWMRQVLREAGWSAKAWADKAGTTPTNITRFLKIKSSPLPSARTLMKLASVAPIPLVLNGDKKPFVLRSEMPNRLEVSGEEYVPVAHYAAGVSAGPGSFVDDRDHPKSRLLFRRSWLRGVTSAPLSKLAVLTVEGDSMENTLHSGDHVLVECTVTAPGRDGIYVIRMKDTPEIQVKRLQWQPNRKLSILSDNPGYRNFEDVSPRAVQVLGRVIWLGRRI